MSTGMKIALSLVAVIGIAIGLTAPMAPRSAPVVAGAATVSAEKPPADDPPVDTVIERSDNGHYYAVADVNGTPTRFVVDTGATTVALTVEDAKRAGIAVDPGQFQVIGSGASGAVRGQEIMIDTVILDGKRAAQVRGAVLEGLNVSLLGQNYLSKLDAVEIRRGTMTLR